MKINKLSIDGNKNSIEISDKIVGAKINNQLISNVSVSYTHLTLPTSDLV